MQNILCHINNIPIATREIIYLPYNSNLSTRAKALRKAGNLPEVIFWTHVHKGKFHRIDFDRQRIIANYIVDFYCKALGLVIEIDGGSHNDKEDYDDKRDTYLRSLGLQVHHISAMRVEYDIASVLMELENFIIMKYGLN